MDNSTYETPEGIMNGWSTHFGQLAKKSENKDFDNDYLELMEREKDIILQICRDQYDHKEVSSEELLKAVKQLNTNKAADYFGITAENIIYGSNIFLNYLQKLMNVSFANGHIPDSLKIGTLFPVFKNKGDIKSANNYRGITVTPTFSKIMEKIIKIRENPTIMKIQNPLQRGFTENSAPLLCELFIEEYERENKDLNSPTYIGLLDGKSAFDVVVHANMIRRLFQIGFSKQSITLINNLYTNASSCIKWKNQISKSMISIEQGVRQGGALSADLYKVYVNPLLDILSNSGLGGKIGKINCCAPTCADDVALIANNPFDIQTMVDIAVDFSKGEGCLLQPQKSVVIPINTYKKSKMLEINDGYWKLDGKDMPIVTQSAHIGIQKSETNSTQSTVNENIKKATRALYSLMGVGLHGENGIDPETTISLLRTYVLPILYYGLEILLPTGKILEQLNIHYKKVLKQILSLYINVADPAIYILSGLLPIEAEIHIKVLTFFGNITRSEHTSIEWRLAERQLQVKSYDSNSWFMDIRKICIKYDITDPYTYLENPLPKSQWKSLITKHVHQYWKNAIEENMLLYTSLKYLDSNYNIGRIHPLLKSQSANIQDIRRIPTRLKIVTGTYILQTNRAVYSTHLISATCNLCRNADETLQHFVLCCEALQDIREPLIKRIIDVGSEVLAKIKASQPIDILKLIINPFIYVNKYDRTHKKSLDTIGEVLEPLCRQLLYKIHNKRYELLGLMENKKKENGKKN